MYSLYCKDNLYNHVYVQGQHKNAISDVCSSNDLERVECSCSLSDGASHSAEDTPPSSHALASPQSVYITKTVKTPNCDIPRRCAGQSVLDDCAAASVVKSSFNKAAVSTATYNPKTAIGGAKIRLSMEEYRRPLTGWNLPPGGGLRGGAPQPGETSAISNGTSGWGPPPSTGHTSNVGGWGNAPPTSSGSVSAWGSTPASANPEEVTNGQKLLNSGLISTSPGQPGTDQLLDL